MGVVKVTAAAAVNVEHPEAYWEQLEANLAAARASAPYTSAAAKQLKGQSGSWTGDRFGAPEKRQDPRVTPRATTHTPRSTQSGQLPWLRAKVLCK